MVNRSGHFLPRGEGGRGARPRPLRGAEAGQGLATPATIPILPPHRDLELEGRSVVFDGGFGIALGRPCHSERVREPASRSRSPSGRARKRSCDIKEGRLGPGKSIRSVTDAAETRQGTDELDLGPAEAALEFDVNEQLLGSIGIADADVGAAQAAERPA